jgi:serine/threonine protein kinase
MAITLLGSRYQVVREIGAGGMGRVFQAVDTQTGRTVAAKVMIASSDENLDALLRFYQEGAVLATLKHPNIVEVSGTFLEDGVCSIVMELLEGASLDELLASERLPLSRVKALVDQIAGALSYAHGRGIVHRDIKPSNIMVIGDDHVKVTDFGIARVLRGGTLSTKTGMSIGTPLYMSPEQIEAERVDGRSDIYSLGVVLYQMVVGRPPFEGRDPLSIAFKHVHIAPRPPSELNPDVPKAWEHMILTMLAKDPAKRYASGVFRTFGDRGWVHRLACRVLPS